MVRSKRIAFCGIFAALAILMGYIETFFPMPIPVPGIKLGLSNIIVVLCLYFMGGKEAVSISIIRVIVSGLLFSGFSGFLYSISGAGLSFIAMYLCKKIKGISIVGVSVAGGVFHNIGQVIMACMVLKTYKLITYYLPFLLVAGIITGVVIGVVAKYSLEYLGGPNIK